MSQYLTVGLCMSMTPCSLSAVERLASTKGVKKTKGIPPGVVTRCLWGLLPLDKLPSSSKTVMKTLLSRYLSDVMNQDLDDL